MIITNAATPKHEAQMRELGEFCAATEVIYRDLGTAEDYVLVKGDQRLTLRIRGNSVDGAFLVVNGGDEL